jgi:tRNA(Glu) U13 pseudouridine synthase TruD
MMCKPQRLECELLRFDKPREPLLPPPFGHADAVHGTHSVPDTAAPARKHLAAKLTFELPSGSYATSLLRELVADECAIQPGAA